MKASIIIPTKNAGKLFHNVINSVFHQIVPWQYEVLIIDSGSTDGTIEFLMRDGRAHLYTIPSSDFGHGRTRNYGISKSSGEFAVLLTQDALPFNDYWLIELINAIEKISNIAGAFGRHVAYQYESPFLARDLNAHFDRLKTLSYITKIDDWNRYENDLTYRQFLHFFSNNNSCIRRSVWDKMPFPEVDFAEDQIWAKQVTEMGYSKVYADKAIVYHSHSFNVAEQFKRSFDEAMALKMLFGYDLCPSIMHLFGSTAKSLLADVRFSYRDGFLFKTPKWVFREPFINIAKQSGSYLGQRYSAMPQRLISILSRDQGLKEI